ncbi:hypothetical protein [Sphingomonas sp. EC-HK361]|uniref:hypothetical protein n=1 Tax=Sphingomonas sp. EC-HK361 TaxID=2038397 RepID=UPI001F335CC6|nr:hypothetical protein [Sphingomonas sp. EC-HK361]
MKERAFEAPILVGGAAAELYSGSAINTGDFDVVTSRQDAFEDALVALGFERPIGKGHTFTGMLHPALKLGFEVVSSVLLDGAADRERVRIFTLGKDGIVAVIALEDMIADRLGQYASGTAPEMLQQARLLFALSDRLDLAYLECRIHQETVGDYGLAALKDS